MDIEEVSGGKHREEEVRDSYNPIPRDLIYQSVKKLKTISDYKKFLSKCGYFVKDVSFNKSFFKDVLAGKKKLLK